MAERFAACVGGVVSADIAVPEHDRERRFYARVLTTGAHPLWREDLKNSDGTPVIGLGAASADFADLPLQWMPHVQVANVAASVDRAVALGGTVLMRSPQEQGANAWAVLSDPAGAAFGLVPVIPADAITPAKPPSKRAGHIAWLDLTVENADDLRNFYASVVEWSVERVDMTEGEDQYADYCMLAENADAVAGVCHARGGNRGLPPVWLLYLPVGDLPESVDRVREEGGTIIKAHAIDSDTGYAVIRDPVGVSLVLVAG